VEVALLVGDVARASEEGATVDVAHELPDLALRGALGEVAGLERGDAVSGGDAEAAPRACVVLLGDVLGGVAQDGGLFGGGGCGGGRHGLFLAAGGRLDAPTI